MSRSLALSALIGLSTLTASAQEIPHAGVPVCTRTMLSGSSAYVIGSDNNGGTPAFRCNNGFSSVRHLNAHGVYCLKLLTTGTAVTATQLTVDAASGGGYCIGAGMLCFAQLAFGCNPNEISVITGILNGTSITYPDNINFTVFVP